jgi:hypothetical protein
MAPPKGSLGFLGSCAGSTPNLAIAGKSVFNGKAGG